MSLCPQLRCGCTITSSSLSVQAKAGGVGYNLETYDGIATEAPDTRPGPGERFDGMRVFTTDTRSVWMWNGPAGVWRLWSKPVTAYTPVTSFTVGAGSLVTNYWVSGEAVHWNGKFAWGVGSSWNGVGFFADLPIPAPTGGAHRRLNGNAGFYDASAARVESGQADIDPTGLEMVVYAYGAGGFNISSTNPFTWVAPDEVWWNITYPQA